MTARILLFATALASAATALASTSLLTWSSSRSAALGLLPTSINSRKFLEHILHDDDLCNFDAVVLIQQSGLLRSPPHHLARSISSATSARSFQISDTINVLSTGESLSSRCNARFLEYTPGHTPPVSLEEGKKHVLCLHMPHLHKDSDMERHDSVLEAELTTIASAFPSHFVMYTGTHSQNLRIRQALDAASRPVIELTNSSNEIVDASAQDSVFFTTGLVTSLFIIFFILLPALMMGIGALSSIQTPTRMDPPKGFNAVEKKNQ